MSLKPEVKVNFDWTEIESEKQSIHKLKADELILLVLKNGKVSGKTKLQKEVFLAWKEVFGMEYVRDPLYHADQFGPYSKLVHDVEKKLKSEKIISISPKGEGHSTYLISESGRERINNIMSNRPIPKEKLKLLEDKKADWDEWSVRGIMVYVYRNYPEYTTSSRVPVLKWE